MPNEKLTDDQKRRVGYFVFHNNTWYLVNENIPDLVDKSDPTQDVPVPVGQKVELKDGQKLLLSKAEGGRLVIVQMVEV